MTLKFNPHRSVLRASGDSGAQGQIFLFFGCRHKQRDLIYRSAIIITTHLSSWIILMSLCSDDLERLERNGTISRVFVAFSREEESPNGKYVQDSIRQQSALVSRYHRSRLHSLHFLFKSLHICRVMLEEAGTFLVCGNGTAMGNGVDATLDIILTEVSTA